MSDPVQWKSSAVEWTPMSEQPERLPEDPVFRLVIHCKTEEQRDSIKGELEKHGIKCVPQ